MNQDDAISPELLIHSMDFFNPLFDQILTRHCPQSICEIGVNQGDLAKPLIHYARENNATYTGIDPAINDDLKTSLEANCPEVRIHQNDSESVLKSLEQQDLYFIDGDHNYHTVTQELDLIFKKETPPSLLIFHDVNWPWDRRDLYYNYENIPDTARHEAISDCGPVIESETLKPWGLCEEGVYDLAAKAHTPQNGVLTAIEDFMQTLRPGEWQFAKIPVIFGLGILYNTRNLSKDTLDFLQNIAQSMDWASSMLSRLERNRLHLYFSFRKSNSDFIELDGNFKALHQKWDELHTDYKKLLDAYEGLRKHTDYLEAKCKEHNL